MTLPSEYNKISMGEVRTELNKASGPISLNDDDVRILFQVSRTSGTIISLHNGHGKSNIMPPVVTKPPLLVDPLTLITQTSVTVTWKAYQSLVIDGQVDHYRVQVYSVPDNVLRWDSTDLPQSATTVNVIGLEASAVHLVTNYRVDVMAKNISATKTSSLDLLTLENIPLLPSKPVATVISKTQIQVGSASTYATTYYIYKDGASIPITTSSMPYTDTVGVYTDHTYTVKGHSTGGDGPISVSSDSVRSLPDAPLAVVFTPYSSTNTTLTINWTLSTSPVVNYYKLVVVNFGTTTEVYRKNDVSNTTTSITISTNLAATSQYTATLETVNESSIFYNIPVSIAEDVWTKTNAVAGTPVVTKLTDQTLGQSQLQVEWNSVIGATSYKLVRTKVISGVAQTPVTFTVAPTGTSTLTFIDGDLATSPSVLSSYSYYRYNVISVNAGGDSALSTISADVRTLPGPPVAVTGLVVTLPNITNITAIATWIDDTGQVNSYSAILKQGATTIDTRANIAPGTQTVTFGSPTALTQDTAYSVTVTTYNDNTPPATTAPVAFRTKLNQPSSAPSVARNPDTLLGKSHLTVTFAAISGATSYKLVRFRISDSVEYVISPVVYSGTTTLTCDDSGLNSYEQYKYQLIAVNDGGDSVRSGYSNTVRTLPGPADASTLTVTLGTIAATTTAVSWAWSGGSGQVTSYVVILSDGNGEVYRTDNGTSLSVTLGQSPLAALTVNHAYSVVIKVVNENTDTSKAFTTAKGFVTTTTKPNAPSVDTATSTTQLVVSWTTNSATTYDLIRYNVTTSAAGVSLTNKTTPFTDTGLLAYNEYQYTVTSNNSASTPIGVTSDKSPTGVRTLPNNPVAVSGISVTDKVAGAVNTTARVNWTNADWTLSNGVVTKYDVSVKSGGGTEYGNSSVSGTATYLDVTVPCGETFTIVIKSYNIVTYATSTGVNQFTSPPVKPTAPYLDTGVTPNPTQTKISLKWTAVATATSYTLAPFKSDGTALTTITGIGSNTVDWTSAVQKTSYYFNIAAINPGGTSVVSDNSSPNILTLADKAGVPGTPTVTPSGTDRLTVSWTAPVGGNVPDSYKVTRYFNGTPTSLGTQASGFVDTNSGNGLSANTSYSYTVQSHTTGGDSLESAAGSGTTWMVAPGAIVWAATTFTGVTTTSTTINWTAPTSGGAVTKYVARTYESSLISSGDLSSTATSFKFDNLSSWYTHEFYVMAYNTNPTSTDSTMVRNYTLPKVPNKPSTPTTSNVLYNSITISCAVTQPDNAPLTYIMYRNGVVAGNAINSATTVTTSGGNGTITYTDTTVSENTAYRYYVQTHNENDYSTMSDGSVSVTTPYAPPGQPGTITISGFSDTQFTVSWGASTGTLTAYALDVKIGATSSYSKSDIGSTTLTFTIPVNTLSGNTTYSVSITAINGSVSSTPRETTALTTPAKPTIGTTIRADGSLTAKWTNITGLAYKVFRNGGTTPLTSTGSNGSYTDSTVLNETSYYYSVKANNASGDSIMSDNSVEMWTFPAAPAVPTIIFTPGTGTAVTATISSPTATDYYYSSSTTSASLTSADVPDGDGIVSFSDGTIPIGGKLYMIAKAGRSSTDGVNANGLTHYSTLSSVAIWQAPTATIGFVSVTISAKGIKTIRISCHASMATHFYISAFKSGKSSSSSLYAVLVAASVDAAGLGTVASYDITSEQDGTAIAANSTYVVEVTGANFYTGDTPATSTPAKTQYRNITGVSTPTNTFSYSTAALNSIAVPFDATSVVAVLQGGGGGGGGKDGSSAGGAGAPSNIFTSTTAIYTDMFTNGIWLQVGSGGSRGGNDSNSSTSGGVAGSPYGGVGGAAGSTNTSGGGGGGGGLTMIYFMDANNSQVYLAVAGGGGGGGGGSQTKPGSAGTASTTISTTAISFLATNGIRPTGSGNTDGGGGGGGGAGEGVGGAAGKDNTTNAAGGTSGKYYTRGTSASVSAGSNGGAAGAAGGVGSATITFG